EALLTHARAAFDELRQGIQAIERIADPTAGELHIGASDPLMEGLVSEVMGQLLSEYPRIRIRAMPGNSASLLRLLRERNIELLIFLGLKGNDDLSMEPLFKERLFVVAGSNSPWLRRRRLRLADLMDAPWVMPEPGGPIGNLVAEGFRAAGLTLAPRVITD